MGDLEKEYNPPEITTAPATAPATQESSSSLQRSDTQDNHGIHETEGDWGTEKLAATESDAVNANIDAKAASTRPHAKPWYRTPNPLRWGGIPPVPDERVVSPEYSAGFLSLLTFGWMTPMMIVSPHPIQKRPQVQC